MDRDTDTHLCPFPISSALTVAGVATKWVITDDTWLVSCTWHSPPDPDHVLVLVTFKRHEP